MSAFVAILMYRYNISFLHSMYILLLALKGLIELIIVYYLYMKTKRKKKLIQLIN